MDSGYSEQSKLTKPKLQGTSASYEEVFGHYKLASHEPLVGLKRSKCKKCGGSRMYFCYKCHVYVEGVDETKLPKVSLPWKVDIIKHAKEVDGKSTAIHAALLSPEDVKIYTYPMMPDYSREAGILLVFPGKEASTMEKIFAVTKLNVGTKRGAPEESVEVDAKHLRIDENATESMSKADLYGIEEGTENGADDHGSKATLFENLQKVIFIDCTWSQAYSIFTDERINHLPTVKLNDHQTVYWRHNEEMPFTFLATIEAIYSFFRVSYTLHHGGYDGRYDNLLYYYSYFYKLVRSNDKPRDNVKSKRKS